MPFVLLHEFFDRRPTAWAHRPALDIPPGHERGERRRVTYDELARHSAAITRHLRPFVHDECVVAILLPRATVAAFAAPLGVMRAGAAYTCLDIAFPDERLRDVIDDARPAAVVTDDAGAARCARLGLDRARTLIVSPEGAMHSRAEESGDDGIRAPTWLGPDTLAYVIYTSGTTGRPKGVMVEHRAIANLVAGDVGEFGLGPGDRVAQHSSHAYDSSLEEIWLAWAAGATVVVMDDDVVRAGPDLVPWLEQERVTMWCPPPTALRATGYRDASGILPDLRLLYVGGEALTDDVVRAWAPGRRLVNGYGPTECAVTVVRGDATAGAPVAIGRPVPGTHAWILDAELEDVADGEVGELCLSGACLARGYWNAPELTARKFPMHRRNGRVYRTGDLARRGPDGQIFCLGRVDSQVKLRGYRIELEEIESRLAAKPGVRAAACRVQTDGTRQTLVAFVVADGGVATPDALRAALAAELPSYMVPSVITTTEALPTSTGGKLDRGALPNLAPAETGAVVAPRTSTEILVADAMNRALGRQGVVPVDAHFFDDLGCDSLSAASAIATLRQHDVTAALTVRDVYETPTVEGLASRADGRTSAPRRPAALPLETAMPATDARPVVATTIQLLWLGLEVMVGAALAYALVFQVAPRLIAVMGPVGFALALPALVAGGFLLYAPLALAVAVFMKRTLVGRYEPGRWAVWDGFYVRHWIVQQTVRFVPWRMMDGTIFQIAALRALGARIGRRVHIHRGVDLLEGGWDLLEIDDDATIGQEALLRLVDLDDGHLVIGAVRIGRGATIDIRASVGGGATLETGASLAALSSLPSGARIPANERWDGVPAVRVGDTPAAPAIDAPSRVLSPLAHGLAVVAAQIAVRSIRLAAWSAVAAWLLFRDGVEAASIIAWLAAPSWSGRLTEAALTLSLVPVPIAVAVQAIVARVIGPSGSQVLSRWSLAYLRVWITTGLVADAGRWLSGTLMWPWWLRAAGMRIGTDCEISTIIDVLPKLVDIGPATFFADGIYLAGPRVDRGTVTISPSRLGTNVFLGNHVVIPAGVDVPDDVLIGVCTVADDHRLRSGSAWFGHPPFRWARRPEAGLDRRLTHDPSLIRYVNRWVWEIGRFALPAVTLAVMVVWLWLVAQGAAGRPVWRAAWLVAPLVTVGTSALLALIVLAMKWSLLGRVRPGQHALWSCWCSRWDFVYVAWDRLGRGVLDRLQGTLALAWYLRAMGMRIGRRVVLGPGFAHVVDPDMLHIDDGATVHALFQAHTFEDRLLKIDRIRIRRGATVGHGAVLFYGADIGDHATVAAHSVVMKRERLDPGRRYEGCPSRPVS